METKSVSESRLQTDHYTENWIIDAAILQQNASFRSAGGVTWATHINFQKAMLNANTKEIAEDIPHDDITEKRVEKALQKAYNTVRQCCSHKISYTNER